MPVGINSAERFDRNARLDRLPPHVDTLVGREREVAAIVYARGASTARDVQSRLSTALSNAAVRSMLMRLVHKGVLILERGHRGPGNPSTYLPTTTPSEVKNRALSQLCDRYFDGSLLNLVMAALEVLQNGENERRWPSERPSMRALARSFQPDRGAHP